MAFDKKYIDPTGSGSKGTGARGIYKTAADNKAAVKGAGYFNNASNELENTSVLLIIASDATFEAKVAVAAGVVTLTAVDTFA